MTSFCYISMAKLHYLLSEVSTIRYSFVNGTSQCTGNTRFDCCVFNIFGNGAFFYIGLGVCAADVSEDQL